MFAFLSRSEGKPKSWKQVWTSVLFFIFGSVPYPLTVRLDISRPPRSWRGISRPSSVRSFSKIAAAVLAFSVSFNGSAPWIQDRPDHGAAFHTPVLRPVIFQNRRRGSCLFPYPLTVRLHGFKTAHIMRGISHARPPSGHFPKSPPWSLPFPYPLTVRLDIFKTAHIMTQHLGDFHRPSSVW